MFANHRPPLFLALLALFASPLSMLPAQSRVVGLHQPSMLLAAPQKSETPGKGDKDNDNPLPKDAVHNPVLWQQPENISGLDMLNGRGGKKHQPKPPFSFLSEDMNGTNPKFDARDAEGTKWRVKLGEESRPEVVASRFLWAVGYFVNEDYVLPQATVPGLKMKRGSDSMQGEQITDARFARKPGGEKKIGYWKWKDNPFMHSREFNGLRVMMAVLNNWDLKDVNNAVYSDEKTGKQIFLVSDIGATFASNQISTRSKDKGNIESYKKSKFITKVENGRVSFGTPKPPAGLFPVIGDIATGDYMRRMGFDWIGHDIPIADAQWIGSLLAQLSHQQIVDAFTAGHFPPEQIVEYTTIVESRIAELKDLHVRTK
jgi:hypothetical protein